MNSSKSRNHFYEDDIDTRVLAGNTAHFEILHFVCNLWAPWACRPLAGADAGRDSPPKCALDRVSGFARGGRSTGKYM